MRWRGVVLSALLAAANFVGAGAADAAEVAPLERFFHKVHSLTGAFHQTVRDDRGQVIQEAEGDFWIQRPDRFRWDYARPFRQEIVSDGAKLWIHDVALKQVVIRSAREGLAASPAALLAGEAGVGETFEIGAPRLEGGIAWVTLKARRRDSPFDGFRVGFQGETLAMLEMRDGFGNTTHLTFRDVRENARVPADRFVFVPPEGVDVVTPD